MMPPTNGMQARAAATLVGRPVELVFAPVLAGTAGGGAGSDSISLLREGRAPRCQVK